MGEADHPGPTSLRLAFGNVSSLILHQDYINTVPADVFAMCETRVNEYGIRLVSESLEDQNWRFLAGLPQPQRRLGVPGRFLDPMPGGVGSFIKTHIPFVRSNLLVDGLTDEDLRRVQSYTVFAGNGMEPVRVIQLYGYARAHGDAERMELNERFLQKIFEESNSNANLPVILLGDFNVEPQYSPTVSYEVNTGNWVDVGRSCAEVRGEQPKWTFRQGDVTSRIDLCLLNGAAMNLFENFEMWDHAGCTIPNHKIQCLTLRLGEGTQSANKVRRPWEIPEHIPLCQEDHEYLTNEVVNRYSDQLDEAFAFGEVDVFWNIWSCMAEKWLLESAAVSLGINDFTENEKYRGRGAFRLENTVLNKRPKDLAENGDPVDRRMAVALKIVRLLDEILVKSEVGRPENQRVEAERLWEKARRIARCDCRASSLRMLWDTQGPIPLRQEVLLLRAAVRTMVNKRAADLRRKRLRERDAAKTRELVRDPTKAFDCLKPDREPPLAAVQRDDGTLTANINEMDRILRDKWCKIFCKHTEANPPPDVAEFMARYERFIPYVPMEAHSLTVDEIRIKLNKIKDASSAGLDCWAAKDLKQLPRGILQYLTKFYDMVERHGYWPFALTQAAVTLIPKGEGVGPLDQRPLSVLPIVYRVWAASRCTHCTSWQERWITSGQHGARKKHGTSDALIKITAELENAMLNNKPLFGAALDLSKAFDNVPQDITLDILRRMGIHWRVINPLQYMYMNLRRYFKIRGYLGHPFTATNGIMQGCPLSVLLLNALVAVLSRVLYDALPDMVNQSFVDDITLLTSSKKDLQTAFNHIDPFLAVTDQKLNVSKTYIFGVNVEPFAVHFKGENLPSKEVIKILGLKFRFANKAVSYRYFPEDIGFLDEACSRIRFANLPFWARALVCGGSIISKISYASEVRQMSAVQERTIKTTVVSALWKGTPGCRKRNPGMIYTLLTKGHVTDVSQNVLTSRWLKFMRAARNNPEIVDLIFYNACHGRGRNQGRGPGEALAVSCQRLHLDWRDGTVIAINGKEFNILECNMSEFAHELREQARKMVWTQTRSDARRVRRLPGEHEAHLADVGFPFGVNRDITMKLYNTVVSKGDKGVLRTILCNGVWTATSRCKLPRNAGMTSTCPYCMTGADETLKHLWWECAAWSDVRTYSFANYPEELLLYGFNDWPRCTISCGILNIGSTIPMDVLVKVQDMMVRIFKTRAMWDRESAL